MARALSRRAFPGNQGLYHAGHYLEMTRALSHRALPGNDKGSITQGQSPLAAGNHLEGLVPGQGALTGCQCFGVSLLPVQHFSSYNNIAFQLMMS